MHFPKNALKYEFHVCIHFGNGSDLDCSQMLSNCPKPTVTLNSFIIRSVHVVCTVVYSKRLVMLASKSIIK